MTRRIVFFLPEISGRGAVTMNKLSGTQKDANKITESTGAVQLGPGSSSHMASQARSIAKADQFVITSRGAQASKASVASGAEPLDPPERSISPRVGVSDHRVVLGAEIIAAQTKAFAANEPFFFVAHIEQGVSVESRLQEASSYYRRASFVASIQDKRAAEAYYVSRRNLQPVALGTIEEIESDKNPLAHHLLMVNDDVFCTASYDKEEHKESLAAASILFDLGKGVEKSPAIAILLRGRLPPEERSDIFGRIFVEAVGEKDVEVAKACLPHGASLTSLDREGRHVLDELLEPGLEKLLDLVCQKTALMTNLSSLVTAKSDCHGDALEGIRQVLDRHINRLRNSEKG